MKKLIAPAILLPMLLALGACQSHPELRYSPERYAKLRNVQLYTREPDRGYELIAEVKGYGSRHTATTTMINAIIDEAHKAGASALIPVENADRGNTIQGLNVFVFTEGERTFTRGRAVRWTDAGPL